MTDLPLQTADQITLDLINYFVGATPRATDFTPGSVLRTLFEAVAVLGERMGVATALATNEAIEQSSYLTFGFNRLAAAAATGSVDFSLAAGTTGVVTVPMGTRVRVPGVSLKLYQTTQDVTVTLTGGTADPSVISAPIVAATTGSVTNAGQDTITELVTPVAGISAVTNPRALFNGHDLETDAERRSRFAQFIRTIQRSTYDAIRVGALSARILDAFGYEVDAVRKVNTVEHDPTQPDETATPPNLDNPRPGTIWLFVHNGISSPTQDLLSACQLVIDGFEDDTQTPPVLNPGFKAAGIEALVFAALEVVVPVQVTYQLISGFIPQAVEPQIADAVSRYFGELDVSDTLRVETLKRRIAATPGLLDFTLVTPTANVTSTYKQIILPGAITLTQDNS